MDDNISKEECEVKHSALYAVADKIDKGVFGFVDENGRKVDGMLDMVRTNTLAIKNMMSFKSLIINGIYFIVGGVVIHTVKIILEHFGG